MKIMAMFVMFFIGMMIVLSTMVVQLVRAKAFPLCMLIHTYTSYMCLLLYAISCSLWNFHVLTTVII
jgi:hypothetical protein